MRVVILGSGGIGAYYGARLQACGHQVDFIARGPHLQAIRTRGLIVEHDTYPFAGEVSAMTLEAAQKDIPAETVDYLLLCTKTMATATLCKPLADWLGPSRTYLVSLQNGVDNENVLAQTFGNSRVIGGLSRRLGGHIVEPGKIVAEGPCDTPLGIWPNAREGDKTNQTAVDKLVDALAQAGMPAVVSEDIRCELWRKLILNNGVNPLSALVGLDTQALTHDSRLGPIVQAIMRETAAAAAGDGVELSADDADEMFELMRGFRGIKTSMLVDREHGRELELDAIPGAVLSRAEKLGIDVPYTRTVEALLRCPITL